MQFFLRLSLFFVLLTMISCDRDEGTVIITYTKATAVYGDLDEIRSTPLNGQIQDIINPGKVHVGNDYLLIGEETKGVHVFDNTDPSSPTKTGFINILGNREFYVENDFLYADNYYDMVKIDISNPMSPLLVNRVEDVYLPNLTDNNDDAILGFTFEEVTEELDPTSEAYMQIQFFNNEIYVDYLDAIIQPSNIPTSFAGNSQASGTVNRIARAESHLYTVTNNSLVIFSDTDDLALIDKTFGSWGMETIYHQGDHLYIGSQGTMDIYSISNPTQPEIISSLWHASSCDPVYPVDDVAYITLRTGGPCQGNRNNLLVADISDQRIPSEVFSIEMNSPYGMSLIDGTLYVGEGSNGLALFNVINPRSPSLIKLIPDIAAYDIIPHPTAEQVIIIAGPDGYGQYEVDADNNFTLISWIDIQS